MGIIRKILKFIKLAIKYRAVSMAVGLVMFVIWLIYSLLDLKYCFKIIIPIGLYKLLYRIYFYTMCGCILRSSFFDDFDV